VPKNLPIKGLPPPEGKFSVKGILARIRGAFSHSSLIPHFRPRSKNKTHFLPKRVG